VEVWQTSNLRRLRSGEEKKERRKKERTNHSMKIYMVSLFHRATINSITIALITCVNNCGVNSRCYKIKIDRYINGLMLVNDRTVSMAKTTMSLSAIYKHI